MHQVIITLCFCTVLWLLFCSSVYNNVEKKGNRSATRELNQVDSNETKQQKKNSVAGTRTRVSRVRAEYPNQLDYNGVLV